MNSSLNKIVGMLFILVTSLILYFLGSLFFESSKEVRLAFLTAAVSVTGLIYTQNRNSHREIDARLFAQKAKVYEEIISTIGGIFKSSKGWIEPAEKEELAKKLFDIQTQILIWAGPDVIQAWEKMKSVDDNPSLAFLHAQGLLAALRQELGHRTDRRLGKFGLIKVYVRKEDHQQMDLIQ